MKEAARREEPRTTRPRERTPTTRGEGVSSDMTRAPASLRPPDARGGAAVQLKRGDGPAALDAVDVAWSGAGQPLPAAVRGPLERSFAADFSRVRVREDAAVGRLGALALTRGEQVAFAPGSFRPDTHAGRELLGHELTHVVQQRAGRVATPQGKGAPVVADPSLEREADEAGARAARGEPVALAGAAQAPAAGDGPIQPKLGFEIEVANIEVATVVPNERVAKKYLAPYSDRYVKVLSEIRGRDHLVTGNLLPTDDEDAFKFTAMRKKDPILIGDGFVVEADESNAHGKTNLEFVTEAIDDDLAGAMRLSGIMTRITAVCDELERRKDRLGEKDKNSPKKIASQYVVAEELHEFGTPVHGAILLPRGALQGVMQVTTGILLDQVAEMLGDLAAPQDEDPQLALKRMPGRYVMGGAIGGHFASNSPTARGPGDAVAAVKRFKQVSDIDTRYALGQRIANNQPTSYYDASESKFGSNELIGLLSLLITYTRMAKGPLQGYAKTIAPLMARTDFAKMFKMLPPLEAALLGGSNAGHFVELVQLAVGDDIDIYKPVFENGLYHMWANDPRLDTNALKGLSREEWFREIAQGTDRLTAKNFDPNSNKPTGDLESLGSFGAKTETVGAGREDAPIFEMRSLGQMDFQHWYARAMDLFRYIRGLNDRTGAFFRDTVTDLLTPQQQQALVDRNRRDEVRSLLKLGLENELREMLG